VQLHAAGINRHNVSVCREGLCLPIVGSCVLDAVHMSGRALHRSALRLLACIVIAIENLHMTAKGHQPQTSRLTAKQVDRLFARHHKVCTMLTFGAPAALETDIIRLRTCPFTRASCCSSPGWSATSLSGESVDRVMMVF
jgi:hypothetical protein